MRRCRSSCCPSRPAEAASTSPRPRTWCTSTGGGTPRSRTRRPTAPTASASTRTCSCTSSCAAALEHATNHLLLVLDEPVDALLDGETLPTEMSDDELMAMVALDLRRATAEP